jgi:hypothetical protein
MKNPSLGLACSSTMSGKTDSKQVNPKTQPGKVTGHEKYRKIETN